MSTVRLTFNEAMLNDSVLTNVANYVITGSSVVTVSNVVVSDSRTVDLTVSGLISSGSYLITVSNVKDLAGNVIATGYKTHSFSTSILGVAPQLVSATSTAFNKVRVVFNENMSNTGLTTTGNYSFTCPVGATITVGSVAKINATTVDITISGEMLTGINNYTLTVSGVIDVDGNVIDATHNSDTFNGIGIAPQVASATQVDATHIDVVFDEAVEQTSQETIGNYSITGADTPVVSAAVRQNATTVRLTIPFAGTGNYVVTVINVADVSGNVIDPAHDTAAFAITIGPELLSAVPEAPTRVTLTFSTAMENNADLIDPANYVIVETPHVSTHATLPTDLLAYYNLDSTPNDALNAHNGVWNADESYVAGVRGTAAETGNSTTSYITIEPVGGTYFAPDQITVACWYKCHSALLDAGIVAKRQLFNLDWDLALVAVSGQISWAINTTGSGIGAVTWTPGVGEINNWNFIVGRYDGSTTKIYVNDVMKQSVPMIGTIVKDTHITAIGYMGGYNAVHSYIDQVGIWGRALSIAEMTTLYNDGYGLAY